MSARDGSSVRNESKAAPTVALSPSQIQAFRRDGFLAVESLTTPEELAWLNGVYDRRVAGWTQGPASKKKVFVHALNPHHAFHELTDTVFRANARSLAVQLLGPEVVWIADEAAFKPAGIGSVSPWHQDEAFGSTALEYSYLTVWMALQETTLENGCLQFIPGSHQRGVVPHRAYRDADEEQRFEAVDVDDSKAAACPLPAGGATVHHCRTLHFSGPNESGVPRRACVVRFGLPPKKRAVPAPSPWVAG